MHWVKGVAGMVVLLFFGEHAVAQDQFRKWDSNGDGRLTREELPKNLRANFERVDRDGDGYISAKEDSAFRRKQGAGTLPDGTQVKRDVAYVTDGHERQKLDLYLLPEQRTPRPMVVWIHGGGWRGGDKSNCPARFLLEHGYHVASINYRLSHHATFPAQIHDCKAAIRWVRANAAKHGIAPEKIGVWGSSAGGHLVALLGTSGRVAELEGKLGESGDSRVQAVVDYYGPTDLLKMNEQAGELGTLDHDAPASPESKLLGGPLQHQVELARQASPLAYVSNDDPPFLIVHGDKDPLVPVQQSQQLHELLEKAGVDSTLVVVEGGKHGPFREPKQLARVQTFFDKRLK